MSTGKSENPDLEIIGQKFYFPDTPIKLIAFITIIAAIVILAILMIKNNVTIEQTPSGVVFRPGIIKDGGEFKPNLSQSKISFWTPSVKTKVDFEAYKKEQYCWQTGDCQPMPIDSLNALFGEKLLNSGLDILGYSRSEVLGQTKNNQLKSGWWWQASSDENIDDDFLKEFSELYQEIWLSQISSPNWKNVYVEVVNNHAEPGQE